MLVMQNDPLRELDLLFRGRSGREQQDPPMAMDAYRRGNDVWVHLDLPGVAKDSIDISVERSVLTVTAQRDWQREEGDQSYLSERSRGTYRRQVHLGESLQVDAIEADFADGVLTLRIPIAERAKPRKIEIGVKTPAIDVG